MKRPSTLTLCLLAAVAVYGLSAEPGISFDTVFYQHFHPTISPLYPLFLAAHRLILGDAHQIVVLSQLLIGFVSVAFALQRLKQLLHLKRSTRYIIAIFLFIPILWCGNRLLTESFAYSLLLICLTLTMEAVITRRAKPFYALFGAVALLMLTRKQFIFLYPMMGMALLYAWNKFAPTVHRGLLVGALLLSVAVTQVAERGYMLAVHGKFHPIAFTGVNLMLPVLYLSKPDDIALFTDPFQKEYFREMYMLASMDKLLQTPVPQASWPTDYDSPSILTYTEKQDIIRQMRYFCFITPLIITDSTHTPQLMANAPYYTFGSLHYNTYALPADKILRLTFTALYEREHSEIAYTIPEQKILAKMMGGHLDNALFLKSFYPIDSALYFAMDDTTTAMASTWIKHHWQEYFSFALKKISLFFGGAWVLALALGFLAWCCLKSWSGKHPVLLIWTVMLTTLFGNVCVLGMTHALEYRYIMYGIYPLCIPLFLSIEILGKLIDQKTQRKA